MLFFKKYVESSTYLNSSTILLNSNENVCSLLGLLGNFNDDPADDFKAPNGTVTPSSSGESEIYDYGILCALSWFFYVNHYALYKPIVIK